MGFHYAEVMWVIGVGFSLCRSHVGDWCWVLLLQAEIEQALPAAGNAGALQGSPVVQELRKLCEEVETIKAEREVIENELKEAKFDMCKYCMQKLGDKMN